MSVFANPLVIILIVASAISALLGQQVDAVIIVTMVQVGIAINFGHRIDRKRAAERLRTSVAPTASSTFDTFLTSR